MYGKAGSPETGVIETSNLGKLHSVDHAWSSEEVTEEVGQA